MIDLFFNFGKPRQPGYTPYLGNDIQTEFTVGFILLIIVVCLIPIYLCVKPCCFRGPAPPEDENEEIEFTNISKSENMEGSQGNDEDKKEE